jgi:hypothetical protein
MRTPVLALVLMITGPATASAQDSQPSAEAVLAAARRAIGGESAVRAVRVIETRAACQGPRGPYETDVISARDGRAIFEQRFPDGRFERATLTQTGGTVVTRDGTAPLDSVERAIIQGHEIAMLVIAPETRLSTPTLLPDTMFNGRPAVAVAFRDSRGGPVRWFFARSDSLPIGSAVVDSRNPQAPPITLTIESWRTVGRLRLPALAVYNQSGNLFRFQFTSVRVNEAFDLLPQ